MNDLSFEEWLFGQAHRDDLIGSLARLRVTRSTAVRNSDFETWLASMSAGALALTIADAQMEYARCLKEIVSTGHSPSFPLSLRRLRKQGQDHLWAKHRAEPHKSTEQYLHERHLQLRQAVEGTRRLYLDTNHWIGLRNAHLGRLHPDAPPYSRLLVRLRELRKANRILCPLSFPLFHELQKQSDSSTRRPMAELMDELSDGVCIQPSNVIAQVELKRQILRSVLGPTAPDLGEWMWTKASAVCGERIAHPQGAGWDAKDVLMIQKVMLDVMWDLPLAAMTEFPSEMVDSGLTGLAAAYNEAAGRYREEEWTFERVWADQKVAYIGDLLREHLPRLAAEVEAEFPQQCAAMDRGDRGPGKIDPQMLASLQIKAALFASFITCTPTKNVKINDVIDALHASMALPLVDAICVDSGMAHRLTTPPLEFHRVYGKVVLSTAAQLLYWLESWT